MLQIIMAAENGTKKFALNAQNDTILIKMEFVAKWVNTADNLIKLKEFVNHAIKDIVS